MDLETGCKLIAIFGLTGGFAYIILELFDPLDWMNIGDGMLCMIVSGILLIGLM